jgi:hypothetical protein
MAKKYHVYISSTLEDLKNERRELARVILALGHIPVTMDQFNIDNEMALIQKEIEESDLMLIVLAQLYEPGTDKISHVEKEFAWALQNDVPVAGLVISDKARRSGSKAEKNEEAKRRLVILKEEIKAHPFKTWTSAADLCTKARDLVIETLRVNNRPGWVRGDEAASPALANEVARLSAENARLKSELKACSREQMSRIKARFRFTLRLLFYNTVEMSFYYADGKRWENPQTVRYMRLFRALAPELYHGKTIGEISAFLGSALNPAPERKLRREFPTPANRTASVIADLRAMHIVKPRGLGEPASGIWELTDYGVELYSYYKLRQFEKNLPSG